MESLSLLESLLEDNEGTSEKCINVLALYLERNYQDPDLKIESFAISVYMSERTLRRKCNRLFGCNPSHLLIYYRIEIAKELFRGRKTIGDVSSEVGFATHAHFSAQFKRFVGLSPQNFRNKMLKLSE